MANRIFYNSDGYIEVVIEGDQTYMSFANLQPDAEEILRDMQKRGQKRLSLIDITKQGAYTADSNKAAMTILESMNYDKVAILCSGKVLEEITHAIIIAMGKASNTRIFTERQAAIDWLKQPA